MRIAIKSLSAVAAVITVLSLAPVNARAFMGDEGLPQGGMHYKKIASALGLSAQQKQDIREILKKNKPQTQPLMKQLITERRSLRSLIQNETIDESAIRTQSAKVAAIEADIAVERARVAQEIRTVLTPEQVQKYMDIQAKRDRKLDNFLLRASKRIDRGN